MSTQLYPDVYDLYYFHCNTIQEENEISLSIVETKVQLWNLFSFNNDKEGFKTRCVVWASGSWVATMTSDFLCQRNPLLFLCRSNTKHWTFWLIQKLGVFNSQWVKTFNKICFYCSPVQLEQHSRVKMAML